MCLPEDISVPGQVVFLLVLKIIIWLQHLPTTRCGQSKHWPSVQGIYYQLVTTSRQTSKHHLTSTTCQELPGITWNIQSISPPWPTKIFRIRNSLSDCKGLIVDMTLITKCCVFSNKLQVLWIKQKIGFLNIISSC